MGLILCFRIIIFVVLETAHLVYKKKISIGYYKKQILRLNKHFLNFNLHYEIYQIPEESKNSFWNS